MENTDEVSCLFFRHGKEFHTFQRQCPNYYIPCCTLKTMTFFKMLQNKKEIKRGTFKYNNKDVTEEVFPHDYTFNSQSFL